MHSKGHLDNASWRGKVRLLFLFTKLKEMRSDTTHHRYDTSRHDASLIVSYRELSQ